MGSTDCPTCGRDTFKTRRAMKIHHSKTHGESLGRGVEVNCAYCGQTTRRPPCDIKRSERLFCGVECMAAYKSENKSGEDSPLWSRVELECKHCGDEFDVKKSIAEERVYCSTGCRDKDHFQGWKQSTCDYCGQEFKYRKSNPRPGTYCSYECRGHAYTGWRSPRYKGGRAATNYYGPNWAEQRYKALVRDQFRCQFCRKTQAETNTSHHVHHITPFDEFENYKEANVLENLIAVCASCHPSVQRFAPLLPIPS